MKLDELIEEIQDKVNSQYENTDRIQNIEKINNLINYLNGIGDEAKQFKSYGADELTRIGGILAILQYNLVEYENEAFKNWQISKGSLKIREASLRRSVAAELKNKNEKKVSVKDITAETESKMARYEIETSLHEAEYEKLKSLKFSINSITHRIETRIKYLVTDNQTQLKNEH